MAEYTVHDLARAAGITPRTVRFYVSRGVLPPVTFRGRGTRYSEEHLQRIQAVRLLRDKENLDLDTICDRLERLSPAEIAALVAPPPPPEPPAPVLSANFGGELWERIVLLPGLELSVRRDAAPVVRRMAEEIQARYGTTTSG